jgi:hypothetical protein
VEYMMHFCSLTREKRDIKGAAQRVFRHDDTHFTAQDRDRENAINNTEPCHMPSLRRWLGSVVLVHRNHATILHHGKLLCRIKLVNSYPTRASRAMPYPGHTPGSQRRST